MVFGPMQDIVCMSEVSLSNNGWLNGCHALRPALFAVSKLAKLVLEDTKHSSSMVIAPDTLS